MKFMKKFVCTVMAAMVFLPVSGMEAKRVSSKEKNQPVISMGDRPGAIPMQNGKTDRRKDKTEKSDKKLNKTELAKDTRQDKKRNSTANAKPKRDLTKIYILPKGYKEITIKGKAEATKKQAAQLIAANNSDIGIGCSIGEIVDLYWEEAEREGIRPDMALSQALLETGYFNFGGSVEPWQHNFCGLGTIGNGVQGAAFKTPEEGVRAHIQHLVAYCSHDLPKTKLIDPRYERAHNLRLEKGLITKWSGLNWTWAMGGEYAEKIFNTHQLMLRCEDKEPEGMWVDYKKKQKELEKIYEKKMKECEEAEKKFRDKGNIQSRQEIGNRKQESKTVLKHTEKEKSKKKK